MKGGLDVTNMSLSNDVFDASNKTGFFVGPMVKVTIPIVGLSFDAAALYDQKEAKVSVNDAETTMTQKSLNIPVNVRYGFGLSSLANVFVSLVHSGASMLVTRTSSGMIIVLIL